ncbi:MAG TPA: cytochrome P450 [Solirubrobacteraceae bacterium]|nr:cytochrome P450 [Solirubrobacteraceae bacterium]
MATATDTAPDGQHGDAPREASTAADSRSRASAALPPGPRLPALAQTLAWALAPTWLMDRCARTLGEIFTLTFWPSGRRMVFLSDPHAVKTLFTTAPDIAPSATGSSPLAPVVGPSSVLVLTGAEHMRQRKLLLPPFHGERMREYEHVIAQATARDIAQWPLGVPLAMQPRTRAITLEVILRAVFGVEAERMQPLKAAIGDLFGPGQLLVVLRAALRGPSRERPKGAVGRALDRLDALTYAEIARRRADPDLAGRADILSLLLLARDADGAAMTDRELRDELVTLLLAGHETTATSVAWALERLVRHPRKLARLTAELDAGEDEYLTAVVHETLRVRPVVPVVARMLTRELELAGHLLPAGTRVMPSIYLVNRNPRIYQRPHAFEPERFLAGAPDTFSWIPFGGGIRRCIGASFALLEMKVMLRTMLRELQPSAPPERSRARALRAAGRSGPPHGGLDERIRRRAITLVPARGATVVWHRRSAH